MNKLYLVVVSFFVFLLVACNGHNEDESENLPQTVTKIELSILDSNGVAQHSFNTNDIITLQAKVTDENNAVVPNRAVSFSASVGSLAITSKLTNSEGLAVVYLTNDDLILGAGSVDATIDELTTLTKDYEFVESTVVDISPNLTTTVTLNNESVNVFKADEEVQISATLTDGNGQGIANKIIMFTADIGTLNMATALTNSQGVASVTLSASDTGSESVIGAGVITSSYAIEENINISSTFNYQILPADSIIDSDIRIGYFDENSDFIEGKIALSIEDNMISAGGTLGLSVNLIDKNGDLLVTPIPVTFISNCVQNGNARIDESVLSINGTAHSTFEDVDCAGRDGADDIIFASVTVNEITHTASETVTINGEQLGSIEFIAAEPSEIVLKGTGGQNQQETSTLTFKVKSQLGNVLAQQEVNFALSTAVGGINLSRISGFTNSQGLISTQISAGTVPTAVRVTASASMDVNGENITVQSQSDLLSINTGLPEQRSMTIAADILNPEAHNISGEKSMISVWLSDNFNNPAPDGTTVNFTTEGGNIEPSCVTTNGSCSVTWTSSEPRVTDHRVTILATALGHETFFDTNGNNIFDDADGNPILDVGTSNDPNIDSGLDNYAPKPSGFVDMSEAWRDDNENSRFDTGETFLDFNNDGSFSTADGKFNGPQCQGANCATENMRSIHVRKALKLVMASSAAEYKLTNGTGGTTYVNSLTGYNTSLPDIPNGGSQVFIFSFADTGSPNQTMPKGTTVNISLSSGTIQGETDYTVANTNQSGFRTMNFSVTQETGSAPQTAILTITITSPNGFVTSVTRDLTLL